MNENNIWFLYCAKSENKSTDIDDWSDEELKDFLIKYPWECDISLEGRDESLIKNVIELYREAIKTGKTLSHYYLEDESADGEPLPYKPGYVFYLE